ncbi:MAG: MBL fold metallo-hydrolase [Saprospiraceae bacterium]|nr:MBL fold metallo-hydrolase [Saprospiraceae bacterium]
MKKHLLFILITAISGIAIGQKHLQDYDPVLKSTLQRAIPVDPAKGYAIEQVTPSVYVITDGIWQSAAVVADEEVILIDAPESFGAQITTAVRSVTDKPITTLIYSHGHSDHIGGAQHLADIQDLNIIALTPTAHFLREQQDPRRLIPTQTFEGAYVHKTGDLAIHLSNHMNYHSPEGDLFVSIPSERFLMVIDVLAPGYVPFKNLDLSNNVHAYLQVFDQILAYDFDVFVGGHLTSVGTRQDVLETKAYVEDLYRTVKRIHDERNQKLVPIMAEAAQEVGWDNKYLLFKVFLDQIIEESALEIESRWSDRLAGVDVWSRSHASTMLNYIRWDD